MNRSLVGQVLAPTIEDEWGDTGVTATGSARMYMNSVQLFARFASQV